MVQTILVDDILSSANAPYEFFQYELFVFTPALDLPIGLRKIFDRLPKLDGTESFRFLEQLIDRIGIFGMRGDWQV